MANKNFPTDFAQKATPASNDTLLIADASAGNAAKYANLGDLPVPSSVTSALASKEDKANKGQPNGYAPLDGTGKVPLANLPAGGWTGDVVWPASATDNALARFDSTTGKLIQNGVITESDNGDLADVNAITLDTTPTSVPTAVGTLYWNQDEDTMDIRQLGSILQVGQEQQWNVRNNTASTITEGTPVYVTGTIGASGRMTVAPFIANGSIPSMYYLGIMTQDVLPGADGKATTFGKIRQINTSAWNDGDVLYCSPTVAGQLTNVKPSTPAYVIPTAFVIHSATNGTIAVRVPTLHEANEVNYSNAISLLTASNVQDAIDELNFEKVNKTTTVNGYSLATDVTLTASDVGAPSGSGTSTGINTGDQDLSGLVPKTRTLTINGTSYDLSADRSWNIEGGDASQNIGYLNIPQNSKSSNYTLTLADSGKHIYHPSADTAWRTWTIPANSSVAFPVWTEITFVNDSSAGEISVDIVSDTLILAGVGTTGTQKIVANGIATIVKISPTRWIIFGTWVSAVINAKGYFMGGNATNVINSLDFGTEVLTNISATLPVMRYGMAGVNSSTRWYAMGWYSGWHVNEIDGIRFDTEAAINPSAVLPVSVQNSGWINSADNWYSCWGYAGSSMNEIQGIRFSDETAINPSATLSSTNDWSYGWVNSSTKWYIGGGGYPLVNTIFWFVFASETSSNPSATLSVVRNTCWVNSTERGYFGGWGTVSNPYTNVVNEIDGIRFDTEAAINPAASLAVARSCPTGTNSNAKGYFMGGYNWTATVKEIDGIQFSDESAINPAAELNEAKWMGAGVQSGGIL